MLDSGSRNAFPRPSCPVLAVSHKVLPRVWAFLVPSSRGASLRVLQPTGSLGDAVGGVGAWSSPEAEGIPGGSYHAFPLPAPFPPPPADPCQNLVPKFTSAFRLLGARVP
jgi:hypothetical protein